MNGERHGRIMVGPRAEVVKERVEPGEGVEAEIGN